MAEAKIEALQSALRQSWGPQSSTLWTRENPALGNCGVSALVAHDHLGGEILKTRYGTIWHFYNRIDGERIDFTETQFETPIAYDDVASDRVEAFADTNAVQYAYLKQAVEIALRGSVSGGGGNDADR